MVFFFNIYINVGVRFYSFISLLVMVFAGKLADVALGYDKVASYIVIFSPFLPLELLC